MKSYVRQSLEAEARRQADHDRRAIIGRAIKRLALRKEGGEPEEEFHARVPAIVRGMAPYHAAAGAFANELASL